MFGLANKPEFSIMQQYTPTEHTGVLMLREHTRSVNNDGWTVTQYTVALQCHKGEPDWVADFTSRAAVDNFIDVAKAEITLSKGHV